MANKKNTEGISIFIFLDKAKDFTEKDEKSYNTKVKKLLNKSLSFIDEKDKP